ncbi:DNA cross-link repair 1A protein [Leptidea sinapis]|uniref:DNA cross-link repair 1A protein n=1 Tax=Leptidea sinapis TaxID=189913 RepID=UPI002142DDBF|nr:DNA cross-link repair 1A protein [Leptidea sinapis]
MNVSDDEYIPSILNPRSVKKSSDIYLTQNSYRSKCSLSLKRNSVLKPGNDSLQRVFNKIYEDKENCKNLCNARNVKLVRSNELNIDDEIWSHSSFDKVNNLHEDNICYLNTKYTDNVQKCFGDNRSHSSATTIGYKLNPLEEILTNSDLESKPIYSVSFNVKKCDNIAISVNNTTLKNIVFSHINNDINVDCVLLEPSQELTDMENSIKLSPTKRKAVAVTLEIKKQKVSSEVDAEENKVLILNTNAIDKLSHVIVQPPNYKLVERKFKDPSKLSKSKKSVLHYQTNYKTVQHCTLKQKSIDSYFTNVAKRKVCYEENQVDFVQCNDVSCNGLVNTMNKSVSVSPRHESSRNSSRIKNDIKHSEKIAHESKSPRLLDHKLINTLHARTITASVGSCSPKRNTETIQFNLPMKIKSNKTSVGTKPMPWYKIVAGTHFAVDAFSYGEIPNVKHYFLTHFHSDHYSGLKKGFNKILYCSKITADLCISRLGVSPKVIKILNFDECLKIEGVEVTAVDANHCPGAVMLVFTLPNGKSLLHTGDFRGSPIMETYPIFWNKDIHTIYLDTTYCNPRYDFITQDESLEMALYLLRQKKINLEKAGKKFSSVLIVCGTYTIGKEKFFLGVARRVGCSVWACPEKDRVLQIVEGRSFNQDPPQSCQLHVVPMKDLTHEKLQSYLDSLQGVFTEVVAFKPSGWENGKNSTIEKGGVTIHGIPYSEHSSFSELIRFVKFLKPKQLVPTVDISGDLKTIEKYFQCPIITEGESHYGSKITDYYSIQARQHVSAVT